MPEPKPCPFCADCGEPITGKTYWGDSQKVLCHACYGQPQHEDEKRRMYLHYLGFDPEARNG